MDNISELLAGHSSKCLLGTIDCVMVGEEERKEVILEMFHLQKYF